ncbi:MAG: LysM peptidoglycan-binding domain-containing protein [Elusimicrobia bacterium]|nr:LysM peptidoglycan-binding domain-containing protein [Elusimicrobiota bacterium]
MISNKSALAVLIFGLIVMGGPVGIRAADLVEVEVRTGDTLHGFAHNYLKDPGKWPKIYELNKDTVRDPDRIYPGQVLLIPVQMLKDKIGDLAELIKEVKIKKREGGDWKKGGIKDRLFPEDGIMTGKRSFARIDFLVGSHLRVNEDSLIYLKPTEKKTAVASLLEGGLNAREIKIITPAAEVMPGKDSEYDVNVDKDRTTRVKVKDGKVDVKAQGQTVTVEKGFRTLVYMDSVPQKPVMLPPDGEDAVSSAVQGRGKPFRFRLQVAEDEAFTDIRKDIITEQLDEDVIKEGLDPGQYYWRAALTDKDGFEGLYSEPKPIFVGTQSTAAVELTSFKVINREERIMKISGYATDAVRVIVNGYPAALEKNGEFSATIVLSQEQSTITVTAIGAGGVVLRKYHRTDTGSWLPAE